MGEGRCVRRGKKLIENFYGGVLGKKDKNKAIMIYVKHE